MFRFRSDLKINRWATATLAAALITAGLSDTSYAMARTPPEPDKQDLGKLFPKKPEPKPAKPKDNILSLGAIRPIVSPYTAVCKSQNVMPLCKPGTKPVRNTKTCGYSCVLYVPQVTGPVACRPIFGQAYISSAGIGLPFRRCIWNNRTCRYTCTQIDCSRVQMRRSRCKPGEKLVLNPIACKYFCVAQEAAVCRPNPNQGVPRHKCYPVRWDTKTCRYVCGGIPTIGPGGPVTVCAVPRSYGVGTPKVLPLNLKPVCSSEAFRKRAAAFARREMTKYLGPVMENLKRAKGRNCGAILTAYEKDRKKRYENFYRTQQIEVSYCARGQAMPSR